MDLKYMPGYVAGFPATMNIRELGGLPTADGRFVRHGLLFRGGPLVGLDEEQRGLVDGFCLRFILDLRAAGEAADKDDYVPAGCAYERVGGMVDECGREVDFSPAGIGRIQRRIEALDEPESFMRDLYVSMAFGNDAAHVLMGRLSQGDAPLYFHCTAGKDRTGVCAALVQVALGVIDAAILDDFMLTNEYRRSIIENFPGAGRAGHLTDAATWAKAQGVQAESIEALLFAIDARYPSREAYLEDEFGLDAAALSDMRDRYLE